MLPALTLITDSTRLPGDSFYDCIERALAAGVGAVLLREKELSSAMLLVMASRLREMTRNHQARLWIHTQADIAEAVDADGVHLASRDIGAVGNVRDWLNDPAKTVSTSCHRAVELALAAQAGADFALLSPVFPTSSHPGEASLGSAEFYRLAGQSAIPVIALGGINSETCGQLQWPHLAVISAILAADDVSAATKLLYSSVSEPE